MSPVISCAVKCFLELAELEFVEPLADLRRRPPSHVGDVGIFKGDGGADVGGALISEERGLHCRGARRNRTRRRRRGAATN